MKVLLAIAHYFRPSEIANHSSNDAAARDQRAEAVRAVIRSWRGHFGPAATLNVHKRLFEPALGYFAGQGCRLAGPGACRESLRVR